MSRKTARGEPPANRSTRVLEESIKLFAANGLKATTMRDIAAAVGLTEGTLYHYFPGKADIVAAIVDRFGFKGNDVAPILAAHAGRPLDETLAAIAESFIAVLREHLHVTAFMLSEGLRLRANPIVRRIAGRLDELFRGRIEVLAKRLAIEDRDSAHMMAAHFFNSLASFWITEAIMLHRPVSPARARLFIDHLVGLITAPYALAKVQRQAGRRQKHGRIARRV
jgi:AcrR family transcriptional regulator